MGEVNPYLAPGTIWIQAIRRAKLRSDGTFPQSVADLTLGLDYWFEFRKYKVVQADATTALFYCKKFKHYAQYPMNDLVAAVQKRTMYPGVIYAHI